MIQKFLNRKKELEFLDKRYSSKNSEPIILYGRRRVVKTELIKQFVKKQAAYLLFSYKREYSGEYKLS